MKKARAIALRISADTGIEVARLMLVYGCAAALALAGLLRL